eukprot:gene31094-32544_t
MACILFALAVGAVAAAAAAAASRSPATCSSQSVNGTVFGANNNLQIHHKISTA